ncbi:MAG: ribonuclease HIII, partial [Verrucomicrobiales bacterium]
YKRFGNVNKLLAGGHAKVIELLAGRVPNCARTLSDQFAQAWQLESAVKRLGLEIEVEQRPRAESDTAVAAASILAREEFIDWIDAQSKKLGTPLPKGAGAQVIETGRELVSRMGDGILPDIAKMHFRTSSEVM